MQLPNKLYSYNESTLSQMPKILKELVAGPVDVVQLFLSLKDSFEDPSDFITTMDCLYALRKVDINDSGEAYIC